jgi:hypothetical protein
MNRNQSQAAGASGKQDEDHYFDLHTKGYGYLSRVREVPVGKNKRETFLACSVAALYGKATDVAYSYYDLKVVGGEAQDVIRKLGIDIANGCKVLVAFRAGDTYAEPYEKMVDGKPELRAVTKGRLLQVTLAKVDGTVVYRAPERDSESDGGEADGGGQGEAGADEAGDSQGSRGDAAPSQERPAQADPEPTPSQPLRRVDGRDRTRVRSYADVDAQPA